MCSVPMTMPTVQPKCEIRLIVNHRCAARGQAGPRPGGGQRQLSSQRGSSVLFTSIVTDSPDGEIFSQGWKTLGRGDTGERRGDSSLDG